MHHRLDLGEIIRNHTYIREIQATSTRDADNHLLSSPELFHKLSKIYEYIDISKPDKTLDVNIRLPTNPNPNYSKKWRHIKIKTLAEKPSIVKIDTLARYYTSEVVLASDKWMSNHESFPGDKIIMKPSIPQPLSELNP